MNLNKFINELKKINIDITEEQLSKLDIYYNLLITENEKYNLTNNKAQIVEYNGYSVNLDMAYTRSVRMF